VKPVNHPRVARALHQIAVETAAEAKRIAPAAHGDPRRHLPASAYDHLRDLWDIRQLEAALHDLFRATPGVRMLQSGIDQGRGTVLARVEVDDPCAAAALIRNPDAIARAAGLPAGSIGIRRGGTNPLDGLLIVEASPRARSSSCSCPEIRAYGIPEPIATVHEPGCHAYRPPTPACGQCPHPDHSEEPGAGCTTPGCLCLETPMLITAPRKTATADPPTHPTPERPARARRIRNVFGIAPTT
jgi:hypothetical protein